MQTPFKIELLCHLTCLLLCLCVICPAQVFAENALAIGRAARTNSTVDIAINLPACLNWKSKEEILAIRTAIVMRNSILIDGRYAPAEAVFGLIQDRRPWWGMPGEAVFGPGRRSIEGMSEESRFILNPLLLVAVAPATIGIWRPACITSKEIYDPNFPYHWLPESLQINPRLRLCTVTYNVSRFHQRIHAIACGLIAPVFINRFSLVAYNARDMGFSYIYLSTAKSAHVVNDNDPADAVFIKQMIHCGNSCGYPGGCNNMSPFMPEIDRCHITRLPAYATVLLWKDKPSSLNKPADLTVVLKFH